MAAETSGSDAKVLQGTRGCEVTVLLSTYNRAYCLGRAIDSILNQTFRNLELVIIDDGSTDDTQSLVESYDDPRIKYIRHDDNRGQSARLNEGILASNAPYIAIQDSDDEWLPRKLEKEIEVMRNQPNSVGVVYTDRWRVEEGKETLYWASPTIMPEDGIVFDEALDHRISEIGPQAALIRRECFAKAGLFDEKLVRNKDWEMFLRISKYYLFYHIQEPLVNYYVTKDSYSARGESVGIDSLEIILNKHYEAIRKNAPLLAKRAYWIGSFHMRAGNARKGRKYLGIALRSQPLNLRYWASGCLSLFGNRVYAAVHRLVSLGRPSAPGRTAKGLRQAS